MIRCWLCLCLSVAGLALSGCGGSGRNSAAVSGRVTQDGKPLPRISLLFQPVGKGDTSHPETGAGSYGITDADGRFELRFSDTEERGAMVGVHNVSFIDVEQEEAEENDAGGGPDPSRIPAGWQQQTHTFEVPQAGTDQANFEIPPKPQRSR
jgi:hypothetical protein